MLLFEILNINCKYPGSEKEVLTIDSLNINKGKLTFIVGESGVGKSTLLETLGMMNNTLNPNSSNASKFFFYPNFNETHADLTRYWIKGNNEFLNDLRNKSFSFVFQNNNLMDSFSALENVMLSSLIQGKSLSEAKSIASICFDKFNISEIINKQTKLLSGGQKQRVAFARAFAKDFDVLFGDEPTGNLDPVNADNLLYQLSLEIKQNSTKGAVIVSHDIERTLNYADEIVMIVSNGEGLNKKGVISSENVFKSIFDSKEKKWINKNQKLSNIQMKNLLLNIMTKKDAID